MSIRSVFLILYGFVTKDRLTDELNFQLVKSIYFKKYFNFFLIFVIKVLLLFMSFIGQFLYPVEESG